jgi:hypothetical protein
VDGTALDDPLLCYLGVLEDVPVSDALHGLNSLNSSDDVAVLFSYMGWSDLLQYMKLACALTCLQLYQIVRTHPALYMSMSADISITDVQLAFLSSVRVHASSSDERMP